ncbi:Mandelate racemase/muconate lactonizing protein (plasmid) [Rhizobium leguminosarum bv. trifolii WSM2304]|uniref:Mandelate racemase/muconate lactonizing protein n=1 Tax=Rhizobium leguminosarum bv. trifolii (strain WSM2304) TaxID=395492 RepID=A0ABF7QZB1_RHILW|nr:mandelate racemase/muconate lactonizing enzyme family protein [Rhizobium leguminosarum]ACI59643.1 Mandelate racemase/muconate lactonizing protein [Rhizobium leguminosarum bv. trifolii WSM2304]
MKIRSISLYELELPLTAVQYLSRGRTFERFLSTFVRIDTDEGLTGWGEVCPWGSSYLPAFPGGVRTALAEISPHLIGQDPCRPDQLNRLMDTVLTGHIYAKAGIDYALWDLVGQAAGRPIYDVIGGKEDNPVPISAAIHHGTPDAMMREMEKFRQRGAKRFSVKVGQGVNTDIEVVKRFTESRREDELMIFDANCGWSPWEAIRVMNATADLDTTFEQPCATYEQCLIVRQQTQQPLCLDECLVELKDFVRAVSDRACQIVNIKIARVGGITKARTIRDFLLTYDISMLTMCMAGTTINDTMCAHFGQTVPANRFVGTWSCQDYVTVDPAPGRGARSEGGLMPPPNLPGLGVAPDLEVLRTPFAVFQ